MKITIAMKMGLLILAFSVIAKALEHKIPQSSPKVVALVSQIKQAKPANRRVLINQLKSELRSVNQASRRQIMMHLRKTFNHAGAMHPMKMTLGQAQQCQMTRNMSMMMQQKSKTTKRKPRRGK